MKKVILLITIFLLTSLSVSVAQTYNVTFKVDMNIEISQGRFTTADTVQVKGNFNDWGGTDYLTDDDGDKVYEGVVQVAAAKLENNIKASYKFFQTNDNAPNTGWESIADNRTVDITGDAVLDPVFYNGSSYTKTNATVNFNVDMTLPAKQDFDPGTQKVFVAGNFTDWGGGARELTDTDGDKIYSLTIDTIKSGTVLIYKFIYSSGAASAGTWESPTGDDVFGGDNNRIFGVVDGTNDITRFWNNKNPNVQLADGAIAFNVDMSVLGELGVYDDLKDQLQIRGAFNGWNDSDPEKSKMNQNPLDPAGWYISIPFVQQEVNSEQLFKYFVAKGDTAGEIWDDGYERPLSTGGGNRAVPFEGVANQELPPVYYDDVHPNFVVPAGQSIAVTFRVDMTDAFDPAKTAIPMTTSDKLFWLSEQPLFSKVMGWNDSDEQEYFELTDSDGDKIYEGTLTVNGPAFNAFEYRYAIKRASDGSFKQETAGFGNNAYRVRYCAMTGPRAFVQPYTAPLDHWTDQENKADQYETWPSGLSGIEELNNGIPAIYSLEQNYPNPFNPSTKIKFSLPNEQNVSLKVYNVLGQEVVTLVNRQMKAGSYQYEFNASKLSSGVYFYTLKAGSFTSVKKMLFLK